MTDKEKMLDLLNRRPDDILFKYFIRDYLEENFDDFTLSDLRNLLKIIDATIDSKTIKYENALNISNERLYYLLKYLKGEMYTTKEAAEYNVGIQIKNAEFAKEKCVKALGETTETGV